MFEKVILEVKEAIKKHKKFIIGCFLILFLMTFELPYSISKTGGIIDLSSRIQSENDYKELGSLNMAYVSEVPATIPNILISYLSPNWDLNKEEKTNETAEEAQFRGKMSLKESIHNAFKVAYYKANMPLIESNKKIYVTYIYQDAMTDLKVGDVIISINGQKVNSKEDINKIVNLFNFGDNIQIKVLNNNQEYIRTATLQQIDEKLAIGILVAEVGDLKIEPNITIDFKSSESGASGGLMMSLAIYDNLTGEDITKGRKIVGTGTIDEDGKVGEIDGIKYKLKGAINHHADIFLVPNGNNYEEALKEKEKNNYDIIIVPINTFDEAIQYLKK